MDVRIENTTKKFEASGADWSTTLMRMSSGSCSCRNEFFSWSVLDIFLSVWVP